MTIDGRKSVIDCHIDIVATDLGRMDGDRLDGRHAQRTAGPDVEAGPVAWTLNLAADQLALGERPAVMRTDVIDGAECAVNVEYGDGAAVYIDQLLTTGR